MSELERHAYEFDRFRLIPDERLLLVDGEAVALPPKAFDALHLFVRNPGHLITKDDFLEKVWADSFVEEATLAKTISTLRKTLCESPDCKFIETVPKSGYRFVADVEIRGADREGSSVAAEAAGNDFAESGQVNEHSVRGSGIRGILQRPVLTITILAIVIAGSFVLSSWDRTQVPIGEISSIAVLPFEQIGVSEPDELLEFGLADSLITRLSNIEGVAVRPTSAVSRYIGTDTDPVKAGEDLQVDAVLKGSIQRIDDRVRVTVQLISTQDGSSLWAERFDTTSGDIFAIQDSVSRQTVLALSNELRGPELSAGRQLSTTDAEAYRLYAMGRYHWNKRTVEGLNKSIGFYEQALARDPAFALAYTGLADCHQLLAEYLAVPPSEGFPKARNAARKALEIDDSLAEAHTSLAYTLAFYDWDFEGAERAFKRALELNPNYATAHQWYGEFLAAVGRFEESKVEFDRALALNPTSLIIQVDLAGYYFVTRQFDKAIDQSRAVTSLDPDFAYGYVFLWLSLHQKGNEIEAADAYLRSLQLFGESDAAGALRKTMKERGIASMWAERIEQVTKPERIDSFSALRLGMFYIRTRERKKALDAFETAFKRRERWVVNMKYSPEVDPVRDEPRFRAIIRGIGFPAESPAVPD